jgi:hypothetical protein
MLRSSNARPAARRRAAILLITIVMLMLFLVIGICFLVFAESQATSSRIYREASLYLADKYPSPEEMLGWGLGELIYDVTDDSGGAYSAIRGHSLARNMYGWNYQQIPGTSNIIGINNETPFNGSGRLSTGPGTYMNPFSVDDKTLINYQFWQNDGFIRHPERIQCTTNNPGLFTGGFNVPYTYPDLNNMFLAAVTADNPANPTVPRVLLPSFWRGDHTGFGPLDPANPRWTDPTPAGAVGKYLTLRPRPADQLMASEPQTAAQVMTLLGSNSIFPLPASPTGDVINLPGGTVPDSIWVDLGYPVVRLAATNRKIKPMFAFLVVDLDNRVNLNVAGNLRESPGNDYHGSNQGFGVWETNPRRLMEQTNDPFSATIFARLGKASQYVDLFRGNAAAGGRYGQSAANPDYPVPPAPPGFPVPNANNTTMSTPGNAPLYYSQVDLDASTVVNGSSAGRIPVQMAAPGSFSFYPAYQPFYQNGQPPERYFHPSLLNPFQLNRLPTNPTATGAEADRLLPIADMQKLLAWTTPVLTAGAQPANPPFPISPDIRNSQIGKLWCLPDYSGNLERYPKLRNLITMLSMDMDRPGAAPGQLDTAGSYVMNIAAPPGATRVPQGAGTAFSTGLLPNRIANPSPGGDLRPGDWRSSLADRGRVNLNRPLADYPTPTAGSRYQASDLAQYTRADRDRKSLAQDIFERLVYATGAADQTTFNTFASAASDPSPGGSNAQFEALRYLAQLAVNIVDYIDSDDISTAFNFLGNTQPWGWVFGTEMPRLVINEAYAQIQNHPDDQFGFPTAKFVAGGTSDPDTTNAQMGRPFVGVPAGAKATMDYRVNFFVELHNPHRPDAAMSENGNARLQLTDPAIAAGQPKGAYKLVLQSQVTSAALRALGNTTGDPPAPAAGTIATQVTDFAPDAASPVPDPTVVPPCNGSYGGQSTANTPASNGYFVLGPAEKASTSFPRNWQADFPWDRASGPRPFQTTVAVQDQNFGGVDSRMYATVPNTFDLTTLATNQATVVLQRLANPYLAPQPNPAQPFYNPYITVDYLENVAVNDAVLFDAAGARNAAGNQRQPMNGGGMNRAAFGRRQPFRATDAAKQALATPSTTTIDNTFFAQNGDSPNAPGGNSTNTLDNQFEWLLHFDRRLASPMDLLYVSTYKPQELTQQFIPAGSPQSPPTALAHQQMLSIPARVDVTRLYRIFEMLGTQSFMHGVAFGGRVPGKININTIFDDETWRAVADAYGVAAADPRVNAFLATESNNLWNAIKAARTVGPGGVPVLNDQPIWSLAMPNPATPDTQYGINPPAVAGVNKTVLGRDFIGANVGGAPAANAHPYQREDLLRKIFSNLTTRSNTFAVFVTTGFFVVRDDSTLPVKLGPEVDPQLRHRMFAVVDRTNLSFDDTNSRMQGKRPIYIPFAPIPPGPAGVQGNTSTPETMVQAGQSVAETTIPAYGWAPIAGPNGVLHLRDTIDHKGQEYSLTSGVYDDLSRTNIIYLDVGTKMEAVQIVEVYPPAGFNPSLPSTIKIRPFGSPTFQFNHHRGCAISTHRPGNPGPQVLPIDYASDRYSNTVVPFATILQ